MTGPTERVRALSEKAARSCEEASKPQCRCRCAGKLHGARRVPVDATRQAFTALGEEDPHYLPPDKGEAMVKRPRPRCPSCRTFLYRVHLPPRFGRIFHCKKCRLVREAVGTELKLTQDCELLGQLGITPEGRPVRPTQTLFPFPTT